MKSILWTRVIAEEKSLFLFTLFYYLYVLCHFIHVSYKIFHFPRRAQNRCSSRLKRKEWKLLPLFLDVVVLILFSDFLFVPSTVNRFTIHSASLYGKGQGKLNKDGWLGTRSMISMKNTYYFQFIVETTVSNGRELVGERSKLVLSVVLWFVSGHFHT